MRLALHGKVLLLKRPVGVWLQHTQNAGGNASLENIIQNSCWAEGVANYAVEHQFFLKGEAQRWKKRVQNSEIIGGLIREVTRYKEQNRSMISILYFILRFLQRFPQMIIHPVFVKKTFFALIRSTGRSLMNVPLRST